MINITETLQGLTSGYTVFEHNQVLTANQLNDLAEYLNEQERMTRIGLAGVGIACGLKLSLNKSSVRVTKGMGLTTDGDLIMSSDEMEFDRYKAYDESAPVYAPLFRNGKMVPTFELVAKGAKDDRAVELGGFDTQTKLPLRDMVAVLLMESFVKDEDLCHGSDCDNLGGGYNNTVRVLLIEAGSAKALKESFQNLDAVAGKMAHLTAARAIIGTGTSTPTTLSKAYRTACSNMHTDLVRVLPKLYPAGSWFLRDVFQSDPSDGWVARLEADKKTFAGSEAGIQYYYSHLKGLVETWNSIRNAAFSERAICCPAVDAFPKHLLLGQLITPNFNMSLRTGFYPSPVMREHTDAWGNIRSLVTRLNAMITTFKVPATTTTLRVTPSRFEDHPLAERAIPYYYQVTSELPIYRSWSFELDRRGMETYNYSYNAAQYNAQGGARNPLAVQIGEFSFFRVEGHLGQPVSAAAAAIRAQIEQNNLPFALDTVMLGADRSKVIRPPVRYTELHRLHHLIRQDVVKQLDDATSFSAVFKGKVNDAVTGNVVTNSPPNNNGLSVTQIADSKHQVVTTKAAAAIAKLNKPYTQYVSDKSWATDVKDAVTAAGEFKSDIGSVIKTEFNTPFDGLISNTHVRWIDWLDDIIKDKDDKEDEKLLFSNFVRKHPGAEHFGGVERGGTFVLVYDEARNVVGDVTVPYRYLLDVEEEPSQPTLPPPVVKIPWDKGIKVIPSLDDSFTGFKAQIEPLWKKDILSQKQIFDVFKDSFSLFNKINVPGVVGPSIEDIGDPILGGQIRVADALNHAIENNRKELTNPALDGERRQKLGEQIRVLEGQLAVQLAETATTVGSPGMDVAPGSDGIKALNFISGTVGNIQGNDARGTLKAGLDAAATNAAGGIRDVIANISIGF